MKFEKALQQLEKTVEQLESGDVTLEKSLELFETGVKMSRLCAKQLEEAEQKKVSETVYNYMVYGRA